MVAVLILQSVFYFDKQYGSPLLYFDLDTPALH